MSLFARNHRLRLLDQGTFDTREVNFEGGAASWLAFDKNVSAALLDDAVDGGETETRALSHFLGGKKWLENVRLNFGVHAGARVSDRDHDVEAGNDVSAIFAIFYFQKAAARHGIARVNSEIHDDLIDLTAVGLHSAEIRSADDRQFNIFADETAEHFFNVRDDCVEIDDFWLEYLLAAEGEELLRKRCGAVTGFQNFVDRFAKRLVTGRILLESFGIADDDAEEIIEVVRHTAGEPANGFELMRKDELLLELPALGDVAIHDDKLFHFSIQIADGTCCGFEHAPLTAFVADAVFDAAPNAAASCLFSRFGDPRLIFGMNLGVGGSIRKFGRGVAEYFFVGRTVVDALSVRCDHGNHVRRIFGDEAKELFAFNKPDAKAVNLKLLVEDVDDEKQNHPDERASCKVNVRIVEEIQLESIYRERKRNDADSQEQRNEDSGKGEPPLAALCDPQVGAY